MLPCGFRGSLRRAARLARLESTSDVILPASHVRTSSSGNSNTGIRLLSTQSEINVKPPKYGQPLYQTHPRLIGPDELTPGIPFIEYEERRRRLMRSLPEGSVVICMGGTVRLMTEPTDFYYLTGFNEPDATLILESAPSTSRGYKYTLFVPPSDPRKEQWEGAVSGLDRAVSIFGADEAHSNTDLGRYLPTYLRASSLYASLPPSPSSSPSSQPFYPPSSRKRSSLLKLFSPSESTSTASNTWGGDPPHLLLAAALASDKARSLSREMHRLRSVKSENEIRLMKQAADLSAAAHTRVMKETTPGMSEAMIQAIFEYHCAMNGSERPAYVPVVASGLVIHYTKNDCIVDNGDLILIDAGCEMSMYASDITRTYPANGRFTEPQKDLYEAVLAAQKGVLAMCDADKGVNLQDLQQTACRLLEENLRQIGFRLSTGELQRKGLYPHYISHHLGSDLHDCHSHDRHFNLARGNVLTIEPGVYVPSKPEFPPHFHGLGVRIEDDIAMTDKGVVVLSANAPKEVVDVEAACQGLLDRG